MRRTAAQCLRIASTAGAKDSLARSASRYGGQRAPPVAMFSNGGCAMWNNSAVAAAPTASQCRRLSSKSPSGEPFGASDPKAESGQSPAAEAAPVNTLVSSEGSSPSLLTGPRVTSKKGYLDRENMIRETQKAIREYYKEGMYQVRRSASFASAFVPSLKLRTTCVLQAAPLNDVDIASPLWNVCMNQQRRLQSADSVRVSSNALFALPLPFGPYLQSRCLSGMFSKHLSCGGCTFVARWYSSGHRPALSGKARAEAMGRRELFTSHKT